MNLPGENVSTTAQNLSGHFSVAAELAVDEEVRLRLFTPELLPVTDKLILDDREHQAEFLDWVADWDPSKETNREAELLDSIQRGERYPYVIFYKDRAVGCANLFKRQGTEARLGYWLVTEAEGKGVMARAAGRLVRYAFDDLELEKLVLYIKPDNIRSQHLAERLGAVKTGEQAMDPTLHDVWEITKEGE